MTTRVLVDDDDRAIRALLRMCLHFESSFEVVGEATSVSNALEVAADVMPDLVTMDFQMPGGGHGAACIREMKQRWPDMHILALTFSGAVAAQNMIEAGAYAAIDQ